MFRIIIMTMSALLVCVSCGGTSNTSTMHTTNASTSPTPGTAIGTASLNGCQVQQAPVIASPANVVATTTEPPVDDQFMSHIRLRKGQTLELHLVATTRWAQSDTDSIAPILALQSPASWYHDADHTCIWRYNATQVGITQLHFSGGLVCPPDMVCAALAIIANYEVTVEG
jgi:hypothetical protein